MLRHKLKEHLNDKKLQFYWKHKVQLSNENVGYREQLLDKPTEFQSKWKKHPRQVNIEKHHIKPNAWEYSANPLCTLPHGAKSREFGKMKIGKMLFEKVFNPAHAEGPQR